MCVQNAIEFPILYAHIFHVLSGRRGNYIDGRVVKNTTRILYKRCIFLRFEVKQHVSALYGHYQVFVK